MYQKEPVECEDEDQQISDFLQWKKANTDLGWCGMKGHIYGVKNFMLQKGRDIKTSKKEGFLPKAWAVVTRERRERPSGSGADPISIGELRKTLEIIETLKRLTELQKRAWKALFTLAFFGIKRIGEYANGIKGKEDKSLKISQLELEFSLASKKWKESSYFILNRKKGKTAQFGKDLYAVYICQHEDKVCPCCLMKDYLEERLKGCNKRNLEKEFLFKKQRDFNKYQVNKMIKEITEIAKIKKKTSHSYRKGGAQYTVNKGVPRKAVQKQADWKDERSLDRYYANIDRKESTKVFKKHFR